MAYFDSRKPLVDMTYEDTVNHHPSSKWDDVDTGVTVRVQTYTFSLPLQQPHLFILSMGDELSRELFNQKDYN